MRALALVLRRLVWFPPTLLGLLVVTFVISRVIPADPVALVAGETATPAQVEALRRQLGFDRPLPVQFVDYVTRLVRGDLGTSLYTTRARSSTTSRSRLPATIELTLVAMVRLGARRHSRSASLSALWRNSLLDHALRVITVSGLAIASFWLGIMLQLLFAMRLGWTPLNGRLRAFRRAASPGSTCWTRRSRGTGRPSAAALAHLALPAATLAFPALATLVRFTRAGVLDVMQSNFVLYERAMGLPRLRHRLEVHPAHRAHVDRDPDRPALRHPARGRGGDGGGVRLAGDRHVRGELDHPLRLQRGDGLHGVGGRRSSSSSTCSWTSPTRSSIRASATYVRGARAFVLLATRAGPLGARRPRADRWLLGARGAARAACWRRIRTTCSSCTRPSACGRPAAQHWLGTDRMGSRHLQPAALRRAHHDPDRGDRGGRLAAHRRAGRPRRRLLPRLGRAIC